MSLDYTLTDIKDWREVCLEDGKLTSECQSVVFATMAVDIGQITRENYVEFALRSSVMAGLAEFSASQENYRALAEPKLIEKYIGLRTNVVNKPRAGWFKRQSDGALMTLNYHEGERRRKLMAAMPV